MTNVFTKDPNALLDYQWDWSLWLQEGETIVSAELTIPEALELEDQTIEDGKITAWLSGGVADLGYKVTCHIVTSSTPVARTDDRSIYLVCRER